MARARANNPDVPPSLQSLQAITLLRDALEKIPTLQRGPRGDPELAKWVRTTTEILHATFGEPNGEPHQNSQAFEHATGGAFTIRMPEHQWVQWSARRMAARKGLLESAIQQLEILAPPAARAQ
jgi:hypothetical protein